LVFVGSRRSERCVSLSEAKGEHSEARPGGNFRQEIDRRGLPPRAQSSAKNTQLLLCVFGETSSGQGTPPRAHFDKLSASK